MNDKPKLATKEEIFDVFRPHGDHDVSAENYRLKKQTKSTSTSGPVEKNHFTNPKSSFRDNSIDPHTLRLSGTVETDTTGDQPSDGTATPNTDDSRTTIRLETFRIGMEERLAAMQLAQQKAKDQLSDLEAQHRGEDKLPKS